MSNLFPNFLHDDAEYHAAEAYWVRLWEKTAAFDRRLGGWRPGWFKAQPPLDGNPIFTAISDAQKKGIRLIQYEPVSEAPEISFWMETFGGPATDPAAIRELVIACAISHESAQTALKLMSAWISGDVELARRHDLETGISLIRSSAPRSHEFPASPGSGRLIPAA